MSAAVCRGILALFAMPEPMGGWVAAQSMHTVFLALLVPISRGCLAHANRRTNTTSRALDVRQFRRLVHGLIVVSTDQNVIFVALIEAHALAGIAERTR